MTTMIEWLSDATSDKPDFKQIVEKSLALFGVLTGVAFSFYLNTGLFGPKATAFANFPWWAKGCVAVTVISLLLRYIVGSAVHLNARYVPKVNRVAEEVIDANQQPNVPRKFSIKEEKEYALDPKCKMLSWLCFDFAMLVGFGALAVNLTFATTLEELMWDCLYFVLAGFAWAVTAWLWRPADHAIARRWMAIDSLQAVATVALIFSHGHVNDLFRAVVLAIFYSYCLFLDFAVVSRPRMD